MSDRPWGMGVIGAAIIATPLLVSVVTGSWMTLATVPAAVAIAALMCALATGEAGRRRVGLITTAAAAASLVTTVALVVGDRVESRTAVGSFTLIETAAVLVLVVLAVRRAPTPYAATAATVVTASVGMTVMRFGPPASAASTVAAALTWGIVALLAVTVGLYLRWLDHQRIRSVVEAQRAQRVDLARDLHDFVAHDVSEMLAQAQAGQVLAAEEPRVAATFAKIEEAAQRALRSMDRTVQMLHAAGLAAGQADAEARAAGQPLLLDLPTLTRRFADASSITVELNIDSALGWDTLQSVPVETSAALYRVAVEALTNVRRHAPTARVVSIDLRERSPVGDGEARFLELSVTDDADPCADARSGVGERRSGHGLPGLAQRVAHLGGSLSAGPRPPRGWAVHASVPLARGVHPGGRPRP